MKKQISRWVPFIALLALPGCVTLPTGPSVRVMPGQEKTFEQFRADDAICRQWAEQQLGISPQETVNQNAATGAVVGTAIGAGLGAAVGAASGNPGAGAAIGAGSGLLLGTASGADAGNAYGWEAQRRYDNAYVQCMYAKGNQVPGTTRYRRVRRATPPPPPNLNSVPPDYVPYDAPPAQ
ncbi:MAG: glycine zipper family protein [Desulfuromonadales bacterium]|nr:glycine zipper family protein [Desulfuromonadales bacterium]